MHIFGSFNKIIQDARYSIKTIEAQKANIYNYKNTTLKLLKNNTAIWFNKICKNEATDTKILQHQNQRK
jgi:uncharacterized protein (DUF2344 family)